MKVVWPLVEEEWWKRFDDVFGVLTGTELSSARSAEREAVPRVVAAPRRTVAPSAPPTPVLEMTSRRPGELFELELELDRNVGVVVVLDFVEGLVVPAGDVDAGVVPVPVVDEVVVGSAGVVALGAGAAAGVYVAGPGCSLVWHELPQLVLLEPVVLLLLEPEPPRAFDELPLEDVDEALL